MMYLNQSILQFYETCKKNLGEGSGWIIYWIIDHTMSISKDNPLAGFDYQKN